MSGRRFNVKSKKLREALANREMGMCLQRNISEAIELKGVNKKRMERARRKFPKWMEDVTNVPENRMMVKTVSDGILADRVVNEIKLENKMYKS